MSIEPPRRGLKIDISVFAPSSPAVQPCSLSRLGRVPPVHHRFSRLPIARIHLSHRSPELISAFASVRPSARSTIQTRAPRRTRPLSPHPAPYPILCSISHPETTSSATTLSRIDATKRDPSRSFSSATPDTTISLGLLHPRRPNVDSIAC